MSRYIIDIFLFFKIDILINFLKNQLFLLNLKELKKNAGVRLIM